MFNLVGTTLHLQFLDSRKEIYSHKEIYFFPMTKPVEGVTLDLYTQNGQDIAQEDLNLGLNAGYSSDQTLAVVDIKGSDNTYLGDKESVKKAERVAIALLQKQCPQLYFILLEGSLKIDILASGLFSKEEIEFLEQTPKGKVILCQFAEFFMNAFKSGQSVSCNGHILSFGSYIYPLKEGSTFQPRTTSIVVYPPLYKTIYAIDGPVARSFAPTFHVSGSFNPKTEVTIWEVTR